jgi:hypothetical protein
VVKPFQRGTLKCLPASASGSHPPIATYAACTWQFRFYGLLALRLLKRLGSLCVNIGGGGGGGDV